MKKVLAWADKPNCLTSAQGFFEKVNFEKVSQRKQEHENLPSMHRVKG